MNKVNEGWETKLIDEATEFRRKDEETWREHNKEADHLANLGSEGKTKITTEGVKNTEMWKAA